MCKRAAGEKLIPYILRYIQEQPRVAMAFIAMSCAVGMYIDMRAFVDKHMATLQDVTAELKVMNTRLEHLEREHEAARSTLNIQH